MAQSVQGTWGIGGFKLPDFGLTELINTSTGRSTAPSITNNPAVYQATFGSSQPTQQQQQSTTFWGGGPQPVLSGNRIPTTSSDPTGGTGGGGGQVAGASTSSPSAPSGPSENDLINTAYGARMNDLNQQENTLRGQQASILGDINSQYNTSRGTLNTNMDQSNKQLDLTATQGGQRKEDALVAARRLYNDLSRGGQQRFGGASSAGEAYQALTSQEMQRNSQQITTDYNNFMGQVDFAKQNIKAKYDDAVAQLEQQKNSAISRANRDFQSKISEINSARNQASADKATQQLSALNELRNRIYNINLAVAENNNTLTSYRSQLEKQLSDTTNYVTQEYQKAQSAQTGFNENTTTNPQTGLTMSGAPLASNFTPTGAMYQSRRDEYPFA